MEGREKKVGRKGLGGMMALFSTLADSAHWSFRCALLEDRRAGHLSTPDAHLLALLLVYSPAFSPFFDSPLRFLRPPRCTLRRLQRSSRPVCVLRVRSGSPLKQLARLRTRRSLAPTSSRESRTRALGTGSFASGDVSRLHSSSNLSWHMHLLYTPCSS